MLKLNISHYGIKYASEDWFDILNTGLDRRFNHRYKVDPCIFYIIESLILTHVDDFVIISHKE